MTMEKAGPDNQNQSPQTPKRSFSNKSSSTTTFMPSWLLSTLADLDERMKMLVMNNGEEDVNGDTFAERAESYYEKRPQLLSLLQDLYNGYVTLSDRYIQTLAKHHHNYYHPPHHHRRHSSQISALDQEEHIDSDAESSLSYQQPQLMLANNVLDGDAIVADLVIKNVEYDMLVHEISIMERRYTESSRKIGLQKSLLEVLESERLMLLNENASLGYRVTALVEENKGLASESMFMKRKASELARCVLKMREDHRVFMLNRKIEDLQGQVYGLERRNKEYYEQLVKKDQPVKQDKGCIEKNAYDVGLDGCFKTEVINQKLKKGDRNGIGKGSVGGKRRSSLWERVKNMDLFLCGLDPTCT